MSIGRLIEHVTRRLPLGARGERLAARHLRRAGCRILARNLRNRFGEVDLLALDPDGRTVIVVEVKSGSGGSHDPEVHLTRDKQRRLVTLAAQIARRYRLTDRPFRFDLVAIDIPADDKPAIRHHVAAFQSPV